MPPRVSARSLASSSSTPTVAGVSAVTPQPVSTGSPQLLELRRQWKWAAVSQFLYTFGGLVALDDVTLVDIEEDLTASSMRVLPRLIHRLLYTLTQDRKISLDNWQTALRKQYIKRSPQSNPLGPEPQLPQSLEVSPEPESKIGDAKNATRNSELKCETSRFEMMGDLGSKASMGGSNQDETVADCEMKEEVEADADPNATIGLTNKLLENGNNDDLAEPDDSKDWAQLSMLEKLESLHTLAEWHFQTPLRLRSMMRSDDDIASWRIEPIGFDAKHNAYWLIGLDRLWIQREPPKPPRKNLKRKSTSGHGSRKLKTIWAASPSELTTSPNTVSRSKAGPSMKRGKGQKEEPAVEQPELSGTPSRSTRSSTQPKRKGLKVNEAARRVGNGRARAAKTEANVKLDEQAKQLAATQAEMRTSGRAKFMREEKKLESPNGRLVLGTRASRRLRGEVEDEWQPVPAEWLMESKREEQKASGSSRGRTASRRKVRAREKSVSDEEVVKDERVTTGLESGDESDLTELSDPESISHTEDKLDTQGGETEPSGRSESAQPRKIDQEILSETEPWPPSDFVEWETICATLQEWENIPKQFDGATYHAEKSLYNILTHDIVPAVTGMLREIEKQRQKEEAIVHRKRSSRIAVKESEKEEARLAAQRKTEEDEQLARTRRQEARAEKEEKERERREYAREQRRREREEREERIRTRRSQDQDSTDMHVDVLANDRYRNNEHAGDAFLHPTTVSTGRQMNRTRNLGRGAATGDDWDLDCEICGTKGVNRDDGVPLMSCGKCSKWQHIMCHDTADARAGRSKRNWDVVDFTCKHCLAKHEQFAPYHFGAQHSNIPAATQPSSVAYAQQVSDPRLSTHAIRNRLEPRLAVNGQKTPASYSHKMNAHDGPTIARDHHSSATLNVSPAQGTSTVPYQSHTAVTFAHYQPQQRGFSPHVAMPQSSEHTYSYTQPTLSTPVPVHSYAGSTGQQNLPYYNTASNSAYPPQAYPSPQLQPNNWTGGALPYINGGSNFTSSVHPAPLHTLAASATRQAYTQPSMAESENYAVHNGQYTDAHMRQQAASASQPFYQPQL